MSGEDNAKEPYDPGNGPDLRYELRAADILRELTEPDGWWRRKTQAASSPSYRVYGRYITGVLSLRGADLDLLLHFENCLFQNRPDVRESQLLGLSFYGCVLPGLRARNLRCRNDLRVHRSTVEVPDERRVSEPPTSVAMSSSKEPGVPDAAVVLTDAVVEGSVVLTGTTIKHANGKAIQGDRLNVSGALTAYRLITTGEVRLAGLRTGGNVNFSGSRLHNAGGIALNATGAHIGGSMLCERDPGRKQRGEQLQRFSTQGMLFVPGARIDGDLRLRGAKILVEPGGDVRIEAWRDAMDTGDPSVDPWPALVGDRLRLDGNLVAGDGFTADGTLRLVNAAIGGSLRLANGSLKVKRRENEPPYDRALHLDGSEISGDVQAGSLKTTGQLRLADVRIGGNLVARGAEFKHPGRDVFSARRATVAGNVEIVDATLQGTLQLQGVQVGGSIELYGSTLSDPSEQSNRSYSVGLRAASIGRDLVMTRNNERLFVAAGGVNLDGARIARRLHLSGADVRSLRPADAQDTMRGIALDASDVVADEFLLRPGRAPQGRVLLRRAHCGTLGDDEHLWLATDGLELEDFRYDALRTPIPLDADGVVDARIDRLRAAIGGYRPGPYDQLAAMLRASGNEEHASTVLQRKQQYRYDALARGSNPVLGMGVRAWSWLQRAVVGYGYRPTRALVWLIVLLVIGSLWFGLVPDPCVDDPGYTANGPRCVVNNDDTGLEWNPVLHTADLLVPIVDFGNKGRWHMGGMDKWVATGFIAAGWILVTTVAAGVTRMLRRP
jgi:hypothetical protein